MSSDFLHSVRSWAKSPGFALAVVLSLALGIGANTAIFSVVNGLLLHPAGAANPEQLVAPRVSYQKLNLDKIVMSATDFADIRDSRAVFAKAALLDLEGFNYTGRDMPERLQGALVTWQWFEVFGSSPLLGRGFHREEDQPAANHVAVLSYRTWERLFGDDPGVLQRTIELDKKPYRIVGVMPPDFRWPLEADLWIPIGLPASQYGPGNRFNENYFVVARLAAGVSYARAASFVRGLSNRVLDQVPYARDSQWSMVIEPLTEYAAGDLKTPMLILLGAVGFVLLIVCSNIAGLMLSRGVARSRELAIRTALGASRLRLIRDAFWETSLLALSGTALGFLAGWGLLRALLSLARAELATELFVQIDTHVLAFTMCAGLICALLFGLMPAWHLSGLGEQHEQLKAGGRSDTEGHDRRRLRSALVAGQMALALVLLVGAGLLFKTLGNLRHAGTGFDPRGVMTGAVALPATQYKEEEKQSAFFRGVVDRLSQTPGAVSAAAASIVPFAGGDPTASFDIEGRIFPPGDPGPHGSSRYVTPGYFKALNIPVYAGRDFSAGDVRNGQHAAIIDVDLARRYWPNGNPIGQRIHRGSRDPWVVIVGIVGHVKQSSIAADAGRGTYYLCLYQQPVSEAFLVVRGGAPAAQLGEDIRGAVRSLDPAEAVFDIKSMQERIASALGRQQFVARMLVVFAAAALLLALIGLYGVISYNVARRTREIGVRTALGSSRGGILWLIIGDAMRLTAIGLIAGVVASLMMARLAATQLFEVSPLDPATFAVAILSLALTALLASLIPALRAARVDPLTALRNE